MMKGMHENIDEGILRWFGHAMRMENDVIAERVYIEKYAGSRSVGMMWKRWIVTVKEY